MEAYKPEILERGALELTVFLEPVIALRPVATPKPPSDINSNSNFNSNNNSSSNLEEELITRILRRKVNKDR